MTGWGWGQCGCGCGFGPGRGFGRCCGFPVRNKQDERKAILDYKEFLKEELAELDKAEKELGEEK
jgi:hypothetical protein